MGIRFSGMLLAAVTTAFVVAPGSAALAQFNMPGLGSGGATSSDRMGGGGGGKGATGKAATGKSSNTGERMGGGGGKGSANRGINLNTSRSN
jgi:hypothetical protein